MAYVVTLLLVTISPKKKMDVTTPSESRPLKGFRKQLRAIQACERLLGGYAFLRAPFFQGTLRGTHGRGPHNLGTWGGLGSHL